MDKQIIQNEGVDFENSDDMKYLSVKGYSFLRKLSSNASGNVIEAYSKTHNCNVAVKCIQQSSSNKDISQSIQAIQHIRDPQYQLRVFEFINNFHAQTSFLVHQLYDFSLQEIVEKVELSASQIYAITEQLLLGLIELNDSHVVHCDIQPHNILYSAQKGRFFYSDFGLPRTLNIDTDSTINGTSIYFAPEILNHYSNQTQANLTNKIDVYSVGIVLSEVIRRKKFDEKDMLILQSGEWLELIQNSSQYKEFIDKILRNMIVANPSERKQACELLEILRSSFKYSVDEIRQLLPKQNNSVTSTVHNQQTLNVSKKSEIISSLNEDHNQQQTSNIIEDQLNGIKLINSSSSLVTEQKNELQPNIEQNVVGNNIPSQKANKNSKRNKRFCLLLATILSVIASMQILSYLDIELLSMNDLFTYNRNQSRLNQFQNKQYSQILDSQQKNDTIVVRSLDELINLNHSISDLQINFSKYDEKIQSFIEKLESHIIPKEFVKNQLDEIEVVSISQELSKFTNLTSLALDLDWNKIGIIGIDHLTKTFSQLTNLRQFSFSISWNEIGDRVIEYLCSALSHLTDLTSLSLDISNNNISANGISKLFKVIETMTHLKQLTIKNDQNIISNEGIQQLSTALFYMINLNELTLDFRRNQIENEGFQYLSIALQNLTNLTKLTLTIDQYGYDKYRYEGTDSISYLTKAFQVLKKLTKLHFVIRKRIGDVEAHDIIVSLKHLRDLTDLTLVMTKSSISENYPKSTASLFYLGDLTGLTQLTLDISDNHLYDDGAKSLSLAFSRLINLQSLTLNISQNSISQKGAEYLVSACKKLRNLFYLHLTFGNQQRNEVDNQIDINKFYNKLSVIPQLILN